MVSLYFGDILLILCLCLLILASAFFSSSETALMAINRYRLRHMVRNKEIRALRVNQLLTRPDRLLGMLLIGNTVANISATALMTVLSVKFALTPLGITIITSLFTLVVLIFAEVMPKTVAALNAQATAFFFSKPLLFLLRAFYPLVWLVNTLSNGFLRIFGIKLSQSQVEHLSAEELRTMLHEAGSRIPCQHQEMLLSILDLERIKVDDVMVPRQEVDFIDLDDPIEAITQQIINTKHSYLPLCQGGIDHVQGILPIRSVLGLLTTGQLTPKSLLQVSKKAYFLPEGTPLHVQLLNFREAKRRIGLVVDEYGDIQGLVGLEDILEEIVGDLDSTVPHYAKSIQAQADGSYLVDGAMHLRELNRLMQWHFSTEGPKTLSGLIIEHLEAIPIADVCCRIDGYPVEVIEVKDNLVKQAKIFPALAQSLSEEVSQD